MATGEHSPNDSARRVREAGLRAEARARGSIADLLLADDARLDDRVRALLNRSIEAIVGTVETDVRHHAARILAGRGETELAEAMLVRDAAVSRLSAEDGELIDEVLAQIRQTAIAEALPDAVDRGDEPSLLVRLAEARDPAVAAAARTLLAAESREWAEQAGSLLPADLHHRLVWRVGAAIRLGLGEDRPDIDRAIAEAATLCLAAHDAGERVEAVAMRLAVAINARMEEVAALLVEALGDRRLSLFVAILSRASGLDYPQARAVVIDPDGERLWLALRALSLDRASIARIGWALSEADPRRDVETFADALDEVAAMPVEGARTALAPLTLHRDLREAIALLERAR